MTRQRNPAKTIKIKLWLLQSDNGWNSGLFKQHQLPVRQDRCP